jgi:hypothetical protein
MVFAEHGDDRLAAGFMPAIAGNAVDQTGHGAVLRFHGAAQNGNYRFALREMAALPTVGR